MAGTLVQSEFIYIAGTGTQQYRWTVVVPQTGTPGIRNIQGPYGLIIDSMTQVPATVFTCMNDSILQVEGLLASTSAANGTLVFAAETEQSFVFATPQTNTTYRVQLTTNEFVGLRISAQTTTGFTVQASAAFSGSVGFDVFI